ncbi:MAG: GNAT family N-acetyltransferase [Rubrivivax sp.]|nr:GNAT family N-acetyltransferase [Rubrivivax sp.]
MREVAADDVVPLIKLAVAPGQQELVASVAVSIAQCAYQPAGRALGLWERGEPVGLLLLYDHRRDEEDPREQLYVWRLLIDQRHQRRGLGRLAMQWVVDEARRLGLSSVGLSHQQRPGHAGPFYQKLGFAYTGRDDDGELEMVLPVSAPATP